MKINYEVQDRHLIYQWLTYNFWIYWSISKLVSSSSLDSCAVQQQDNTRWHSNTHWDTLQHPQWVVYLKAATQASLTVRAICLGLVKQERQPCLQLSNPNTIIHAPFLSAPLCHESWGLNSKKKPPSLLCFFWEVWKSSADGGKRKNDVEWKKRSSLSLGWRMWKQREKVWMTMWQFKPSPTLWLLSVTTWLSALSMEGATCSQQFIFNQCSRGQREGSETKAECRSQRGKQKQ